MTIERGGPSPPPFRTMQASTLITPRLAEEAINSRLTCLPIESLPLTQCVGGTLRENVYAERDQPPFDRVTMDGIAVDSEALRRGCKPLSHPGDPRRPARRRSSSQRRRDAIEVMTGAILPLGQRLRHSRRAARRRRRLSPRSTPTVAGRPTTTFIGAAATAARAHCCWKPARCCARPKSRWPPRRAWRGCG